MDWANPYFLFLIPPAWALLFWIDRGSTHPMPPERRRLLYLTRGALVTLALLALAGPAVRAASSAAAVIFVLDHSESQGRKGLEAQRTRVQQLVDKLPAGVKIGFVSAGGHTVVERAPSDDRTLPKPEDEAKLQETDGAQTDLSGAVALASGLFPAGSSRTLVLVSDGVQTRGDLETSARNASLGGTVIHAVPVAGEVRPDVRVESLTPTRARVNEGASVDLTATIDSAISGKGTIRLFENGIEVESRPISIEAGKTASVQFSRTPRQRNLYSYRVRVEGIEGDAIPDNNEGLALVDVAGRPLLLYLEGEPGEGHYLADAMAKEGIQLQTRSASAMPQSLQELAGYDGIIVSDVPAAQFSDASMALMRDYVEQLGGGFLMIGGKNSFGAGGYYRTPIEDILPVKMKSPNEEEQQSVALCFVVDRSGSMAGEKIEICKSAAIATVELLSPKDFVGVVAFDSNATWIVDMTQVTSVSNIAAMIATISPGGGTNIYPGMIQGRTGLEGIKARIKHMIVLTDGQTSGTGYEALAADLKSKGITVSSVGVGADADLRLLQAIAASGGGSFYYASEASMLPRIFTQDAMVHLGKLIREEAFAPRQVERNPMLKNWDAAKTPQLLGYVKTNRKATAQVPLVTDTGEPLLATWRFGLGKVTAFTSDCKSRWASLWITGWSGYSPFWAQVLREMAREPSGQFMDLQIEQRGEEARVVVDLLRDATEFRNAAQVDADVYFVPATALGGALQPFAKLPLAQTAPGRYQADFNLKDAGVYIIRARSGADMVSAGIVRNISGETAGGKINLPLLESAATLSGGTVLKEGESIPLQGLTRGAYVDMTPWIVRLLLLLFLADILIRRWENATAMAEYFGGMVGLGRRKGT
ncbi:MAG: VWA domain-containing protein [Candidatus Methylacidiphilales bacterium]